MFNKSLSYGRVVLLTRPERPPPADEVCRGGGGGGGLDADDESSLDALERGETNDPTAEVLTRLEQQNISRIMEVKKTLLEQQKTLMGVIHARSRELEAAARQKGFTSMSQDTSKVRITFKIIL